MIGDSTVGWQIARWVRANARQLGAMEVIYSQHIWTVQRSSEGWRMMSDRGGRHCQPLRSRSRIGIREFGHV